MIDCKRMETSALYHAFFYQNEGYPNRAESRSASVSYAGNHFYSYSTEIGMIWNKTGDPVLFLSYDSLSNTTAKHISALRAACPFKVLCIPFKFDDDFSHSSDEHFIRMIISRFERSLRKFNKEHLTALENRASFTGWYKRFCSFVHFTDGSRFCNQVNWKYIYELMEWVRYTDENDSEIRKLRAEKARKTKEANKRKAMAKAERIAKTRKLILEAGGLFKYARTVKTNAQWNEVYEVLDTNYVCWPDVDKDGKDIIRTSAGIKVDANIVCKMLKLWKAGKVKEGMHLACYLITHIGDDYVQVGCHKIVRENIDALYKALC